jgi:RNA polymerase sigma factor (sigma-70 family)
LKSNTPYTIANEAWVVNQCHKNDRRAQKFIYDTYSENMLLICLRYTGNMEDAREAMLSGFYNFFSKLDKFSDRGTGSVRAWLKKLIVNECLMLLRRRPGFVITSTEDMPDMNVPANENVLTDLSVKEIMRLIQELPDGYRIVFNLSVFEQKTHKEIAMLLGISENTSKSQLHKARITMQKKLLELNY